MLIGIKIEDNLKGECFTDKRKMDLIVFYIFINIFKSNH